MAAAGPSQSMLRQRVLTVAVLLPLLLGCLFLLPNTAWALLTIVPTALGAREWARLSGFNRTAASAFVALVACSALALMLLQWRLPAAAAGLATGLYLVALAFWSIAVPGWLYFKWRVTEPAIVTVVGWIVLIPAWLALAMLQKSALVLLLILLVVWIADTAAYFSGRRFGRRKLAPAISPGKTWEGVIGAVIAVLLYGLVAAAILRPDANAYDRGAFLVFVCMLTALSIIGDLFESWIKRQAGAKDSGGLLPGHGGVLDRIDSLTAALPFAALYFLQAA